MSEGKKAMVRSQERPASTSNGYLMLLLWLALIPWTICRFLTFGGPRRTTAGSGRNGWSAGSAGSLSFLFILFGFFMIQPNMSAVITLFGEYQRHRAHAGPALDLAVDGPQEDLGAPAQRPFGAGQGQRLARQPDRGRLQRGVARRRHRAGGVRRRRLQDLRQHPDRGRAAHRRRAPSLRRHRARRDHAAFATTRSSTPSCRPSSTSGSRTPASWSTRRG